MRKYKYQLKHVSECNKRPTTKCLISITISHLGIVAKFYCIANSTKCIAVLK